MSPVDLVTFLRARLDDDEAGARAAAIITLIETEDDAGVITRHETGSGRWLPRDHPARTQMVRDAETDDTIAWDEGAPSEAQAVHIARHDPARVLAEVAAKRAIVAAHAQTEGMGWEPDEPGRGYGDMASVCTTCGTSDEYGTPWPCATLRQVAVVYAEHPDYDAAWRP